jgi:hypothetical protein
MALRQHIGSITLLVGSVLALGGVMYLANAQASRSAADLAVADRCVDWAHTPREAQPTLDPETAAKCDLYFRVRSEKNADEDEKRWSARTPALRSPR